MTNTKDLKATREAIMTGHPSVPEKRALREEMKRRRFAMTEPEIRSRSERICTKTLSLAGRAETVMVYVSKKPEVDTGSLITGLLARGTRVVVPIIERETTSLRLSYLDDPSVLIPGTFNVPEPGGNELPASPRDVQLVIIPMLAFDRRGNRLGYGAGYYDRFLSGNRDIPRIGLAFACQESESVPSDENDVRMDIIVTEDATIRCGESG